MRPLQPQLTLGEKLRSYSSLFVRSMKAGFAYRSSTVTSVMTATFIYAIPMLVWRQVYAQNPNGPGVSRAKMFPYLLLACCVNYALSMGVEFRIGQRIRQGLIATDLLKPVDFQIAQGIQSISDSVFNAFLGMTVFYAVTWSWARVFFQQGSSPCAFFSSAFFLPSSFNTAFASCSSRGPSTPIVAMGSLPPGVRSTRLFSGMSAPLSMYPPFLMAAGEWLPFRHTIYTPVSIYMGWVQGPQAVDLILQQALWVLGLFFLGKLLMVRSLKQLEVQGG